MRYPIHRAVVIGAGTMGAAIAAHLVNAGVQVTLLDIVPRELTPDEALKGLTLQDWVVRNRLAQQGLERALKSKPPSFFVPDLADLVKVGNLEDDLGVISLADWVIEAVVENLSVKRQLMERLDVKRAPHTIISTNTSGIPVASIAQGRSEEFRRHFLGTHFFNPPRYLKLVELIPTADTLPEVAAAIAWFTERHLGKGVVPAKDTPNFIGNRLASVDVAFLMDYILTQGYTIDEVDAITGPLIGRPRTATFRLLDLIGLDIWEHIGTNLAQAIPHDKMAMQYLNAEPGRRLLHTMVENGRLGNKSRQGFYKEVLKEGKKEFWSLNLNTLEYEPPIQPTIPSLKIAKDAGRLGARLKILLAAEDRAGQLVRALTYHDLAYASACIPEVADTPQPIDNAMCWGFSHEVGPFEIWDLLGVSETLAAIKLAGFSPAVWVDEMLALGFTTFYQYQGDRAVGVYNPLKRQYEKLQRPTGLVLLKEQKAAGKVVIENASASLIDLDDGVACLEFHTKMNTLDEDIFSLLEQALERTKADFGGLVIGNQGEAFSAGMNLVKVITAAQNGQWQLIKDTVIRMQSTMAQMRYFPLPVVAAPAGLTLGGGAEIILHASRVVAAAELNIGLVEFGAGLIPAGGGVKEMLHRILNPAMRPPNTDAHPSLQRIFEQISYAKTSTSAEEARQMGFLCPGDRVVMNRDLLIAEAKREVLHLAAGGFRPPYPEKIYAAGRDALAFLRISINWMKEGRFITEYDGLIADRLAYVLTGGELSRPTWIDEQYILDLEVEAFLSLCGNEKSQQRMQYILQTGKPLRN